MVNDTTTLNGALSQLGETMATNIAAKGVSASASDGLTTLAGKILQISGDTPTPSTVIYEDDCSVDNTSDYGSSISLRNSGSSTLAYNSNEYYTIIEFNKGFISLQIDKIDKWCKGRSLVMIEGSKI